MLQYIQHNDVIGGTIATIHLSYHPPLLLQCCYYKPCKRLGSHMLLKVKAN